MTTTRRQFIKISTLGAGGVALTASALKWTSASNLLEKLSAGPITPMRTPTYCEICFWQCAGWVYKNEDGSIKKIVGNDDDPHCNGRFCPRGTGGIGQYNDTDRLKTPMIRQTIDGVDSFREADWDEALDHIATKMKEISAKNSKIR